MSYVALRSRKVSKYEEDQTRLYSIELTLPVNNINITESGARGGAGDVIGDSIGGATGRG